MQGRRRCVALSPWRAWTYRAAGSVPASSTLPHFGLSQPLGAHSCFVAAGHAPQFWLLANDIRLVLRRGAPGNPPDRPRRRLFGGLGGLAVPIMSLVISPVRAAGIMRRSSSQWTGSASGPTGAIGTAAIWRSCCRPALLGIAVGYGLAARVTDAHVRLIVGVVALVFSLDYWLPLRRKPGPRGPSLARGSLWGAIAGF